MRYANEIITLNNGKRVKQVNKTTARKYYENGKTVYIHSCNMTINNMWQSLCPVNQADYPDGFMQSFDSIVYSFKYYNCDSERGKYPIYFIEV